MVDTHSILVRKGTSNLTLAAELARLPLLVWALMGDLILNLHGEEAGHRMFDTATQHRILRQNVILKSMKYHEQLLRFTCFTYSFVR